MHHREKSGSLEQMSPVPTENSVLALFTSTYGQTVLIIITPSITSIATICSRAKMINICCACQPFDSFQNNLFISIKVDQTIEVSIPKGVFLIVVSSQQLTAFLTDQ